MSSKNAMSPIGPVSCIPPKYQKNGAAPTSNIGSTIAATCFEVKPTIMRKARSSAPKLSAFLARLESTIWNLLLMLA